MYLSQTQIIWSCGIWNLVEIKSDRTSNNRSVLLVSQLLRVNSKSRWSQWTKWRIRNCAKINRGNFQNGLAELKVHLTAWVNTINTFLDELKALSTPTNWVYWWNSCQAPSSNAYTMPTQFTHYKVGSVLWCASSEQQRWVCSWASGFTSEVTSVFILYYWTACPFPDTTQPDFRME